MHLPTLRRRPRYADVVATLALVLALGGTAYAATAIPRHSVGAKQLKRSAVTPSKVHSDAIRTAKLANGAVTGRKVAAHSIRLSNLVGADAHDTLTLSLTATDCITQDLPASGVKPGQAATFSFVGNTAVPNTLLVGPLKVITAGTVRAAFCNLGQTPLTISDAPVRIVTFN